MKLSEWILLLVHNSLFSHGNWMMRCPKYLFDCCPLVKIANDENIDRLMPGLNPVQEFSYLVLRRLAEVIAQLVTSWLISVWIITFMIFVGFVLKQVSENWCTLDAANESDRSRHPTNNGWFSAYLDDSGYLLNIWWKPAYFHHVTTKRDHCLSLSLTAIFKYVF